MTDEQVRAGITVLQNEELAQWVYGLLSMRYAPKPTPGQLGPIKDGGTAAPPPPVLPPFTPPFVPAWFVGVKRVDPYTGEESSADDFEFATKETAEALAKRFGGTASSEKWTTYTQPTYEFSVVRTAGGKAVKVETNAGLVAKYYRDLKSEQDLKDADAKANYLIDANARQVAGRT